MHRGLAAFGAAFLLSTAPGASKPLSPGAHAETREPCAHREAERRPFFGDLHVHTAYSQDASTQGTRTTPRDAYRFARGETLGLQPFDADGKPLRTRAARPPARLRRRDRPRRADRRGAHLPHARRAGVRLARSAGSTGTSRALAFFVMNAATRAASASASAARAAQRCLAAARTVWQETQDAAEARLRPQRRLPLHELRRLRVDRERARRRATSTAT